MDPNNAFGFGVLVGFVITMPAVAILLRTAFLSGRERGYDVGYRDAMRETTVDYKSEVDERYEERRQS